MQTNKYGSYNTLSFVGEEHATKAMIEAKTNKGKKGGAGIYFINVLNCTTGKLEVEKVILE